MGRKEEYMEKLNSQLRSWGARIDEFTERAEFEALEHKTKLKREIADFRIKRLDAQLKLQQLKETTGDAWEKLEAGLDRAWEDMKASVHRISEKFKQPR